MEAHYLDALEIESYAQEPLSEMERKDFIAIITSLRETIDQQKSMISELKAMIKSLEAKVESDKQSTESKDKLIGELRDQIAELTKMLASAIEQNKRHKRERYDRTSMKGTKNKPDAKKSREEEKDDYDGSDNNTPSSSDVVEESKLDQTKVSSEFLGGSRGPRGTYNTMMAAYIEEHMTSLMPILPAGWKLVTYKNVDEYTKVSYIKCDRYVVAVYEDEFGNRKEYFCPLNPEDTKRPHIDCIPSTHCCPELMVDIILNNFAYHLPNHRSNSKMEYDGLRISENTRTNWLHMCAGLLQPLNPFLKSELFADKFLLNIDETWYRIRIKVKGDGKKLGQYKKKYIWCIVNKRTKAVYFLYDNDEEDSRGLRPIQVFLGDYVGAIQSDGYTVYKQLAKKNPNIKHLECWAHVIRKFKEAALYGQDKEASWFVEQIGRLYLIETECLLKGLSAEMTRERRNKRDVNRILSSLKERADYLLNCERVHYGEMMRKALTYMINSWDNLLRYREHGDYSIDNMAAERAIRPVVMNRKGGMFHSSERGAEMAMFFHSLIETGKSRGLHLKNWLTSLIREMMNGNQDYAGLLSGAYCA